MKLSVGFTLVGSLIFICTLSAQMKFYSNPEPVLGLNSQDSEDYLYLSSNGSEIIYSKLKSSANVGGNTNPADIWFGDISDKPLIDSILVESFGNADYFSSPIGYTPDKRFFLYNRTLFSQGIYEGAVMAFDVKNQKHSEVKVPYFKNKAQAQTGFISRDGNYMLISLESESGYGVEDLYVCIANQDGEWSAPRNLGRTINTQGQELTPFLLNDNKTLYFSTNAREGLGSFDIYFSTRLDESWRNWSEPRNLGSFVNTEGAETSFMFNPESEYAYFISTQNSDGYGDIKRVRIYPTNVALPADTATSEPLTINSSVIYEKEIKFLVLNKKTEENLDFNYLGNVFRNGKPERVNSFQSTVANVKFGLDTGDSLDLEFKSKGFLSKSTKIRFNELDSLRGEYIVKLDPLETGNVIRLDHVLFKKATSSFLEGSKEELELVLEMLNDNPDVKIFLKGHTDNVGNKVLNIQLSQARVNVVRDYLVERGVAKERISGRGFGGSKPLTDNRTEEARQLNRRVEFEIVRD
ncbi:MAG: OmpA family protein [Cyclobacteriaceae bacterium]